MALFPIGHWAKLLTLRGHSRSSYWCLSGSYWHAKNLYHHLYSLYHPIISGYNISYLQEIEKHHDVYMLHFNRFLINILTLSIISWFTLKMDMLILALVMTWISSHQYFLSFPVLPHSLKACVRYFCVLLQKKAL